MFHTSSFINTKILLFRLVIDKSISISTLIFFKNFLILILKIRDRFVCWWLVKWNLHNSFETKFLIFFMFMIFLKLIMTLRYFKCINFRCQIFISIINLKNAKIDIFSTLIDDFKTINWDLMIDWSRRVEYSNRVLTIRFQ